MRTQQSAIKRLLFILFGLTLFISCHERLSKTDREVITTVVDKYASLPPPPPSSNSNDTIISEKLADSLNQLKLKIGIWPKMQNSIDEDGLTSIPEEFLNLIDKGSKGEKIEYLDNLSSPKGHKIFIVDTSIIKESMDFKNFDLLFNFSKIHYNKSKNLALFELGISQSRLSGSSAIYCLRKDSDVWKVEAVVQTTIW